jgi:hypothetical protein
MECTFNGLLTTGHKQMQKLFSRYVKKDEYIEIFICIGWYKNIYRLLCGTNCNAEPWPR